MAAALLETTSAAGSLWLDTGPGIERARLAGDLQVDVAELGGGVAGLTVALLLKRDGARVVVLEAARVGSGVTGCTTAKVSALQAHDLLDDSPAKWRAGRRCLRGGEPRGGRAAGGAGRRGGNRV